MVTSRLNPREPVMRNPTEENDQTCGGKELKYVKGIQQPYIDGKTK
jgi:hypothetical protein